ncbi:hypothetical protein AAVH_08265 [Aphelenchoides avenae]|nr:hypothetical protein AAVH_08265 [Aphelenchus avenae]
MSPMLITDDVVIDVLRAIPRDEVDATQLANHYMDGVITSNTFKAVTPLRPLVMTVGCGAISVKRHEEDNIDIKTFYETDELTDWARNGCAMIFSLDAQSEDNVMWFLENCSTFTVQRTNLKVPFCSEELEQQLMAKSLGTDIAIKGDSPAVPRLLMDLKHATFEPCYKLRFEDKRTRLTVTAKQLRRWLHLPVHRNSEGRIAPRDVNMHTRQIDGDVIKMLLRLRKKFLEDDRNDVSYRLYLVVSDEHLSLFRRFAEVQGRHFREGGYFNVSSKYSNITVSRYIMKD